LKLQVRGDQEARLCPCVCAIPSLDKKAQSLNHAFTLISEAYETLRRSHSGNVFERVYAQDKTNKWVSLDEIRITAIAQAANVHQKQGDN
jgi:hypothetical protein